MRVINKTAYSTRAIHKILTTVHASIARNRGRLRQWKRAECFVEYRRTRWQGGNAGWAVLGGSRMCLRLARPHHNIMTEDVAVIAWHELLHLYGFREADMPKTWTPENRARWQGLVRLLGIHLPVKQPKPRKIVDRGQKALSMLARWQRREKLARTKVRLYRKKVAYYNRKKEAVPDETDGRTGDTKQPS